MNKLRHIKISPEEFFKWFEEDAASSDEHKLGDFDGLEVLSNLLNYKVFKHKGIDCPVCHSKGAYFALERTPGGGRNKYNKWHFNLYAKDAFDRDVLMTKDHIHPRANGGTDDLDNLQPMCQGCNSRKGSTSMEAFKERIAGRASGNMEIVQCNRVIFSMKRHYKMDITPKDFLAIKSLAFSSPVILKDGWNSYRELSFNGQKVIVVWDVQHNTVLDVENYNDREALIRRMPKSLEEFQAEADELFYSLIDLIKDEYSRIPQHDKHADTFRLSKYPTLMFDLHNGKETSFKRNVRNVVISKLKKRIRDGKRASSV